jgi:DNA repair protein RadC
MDEPEPGVTYTLIRDLPEHDRPRERLRDSGADALSAAELIAILLRVGGRGENAVAMAQRLLSTFGGLPGLARASFTEMCNEKGLGEAKTAQIKAALELGVRLAKAAPEARPVIRSADDVADLVVAEMSPLDQEQVRVMQLDARRRLLSMHTVYIGTVHTTQVRISELLSEAVRVKAAAIVLIHNHPSGDPAPSAADGQMTHSLFEASKLMDIELEDHIVVGGGRYVSLRAAGLGFPKDRRT